MNGTADDGAHFALCFICGEIIDFRKHSATKWNDIDGWMHAICCLLFYRIHNHKVDNELVS
jgi:hypothetical protein